MSPSGRSREISTTTGPTWCSSCRLTRTAALVDLTRRLPATPEGGAGLPTSACSDRVRWAGSTRLFFVANSTDLAAAGERLAADGANVRVRGLEGWHRYRGNMRDLLDLNRVALDRLSVTIPPVACENERTEAVVCAWIRAPWSGQRNIGPTVIGPGATVDRAYIGPYTSIGAGARIEGTEIERSIVAQGASLMHVGVRLASSFVGRDARVFRDFSLPRALRLQVGAGDEIALC